MVKGIKHFLESTSNRVEKYDTPKLDQGLNDIFHQNIEK